MLWEMQELTRFPTLKSDIAAAATEALERFRDESRKTVLRLVDMESSYLTVEFFRKLHAETEKTPAPNPSGPHADRYADNHFRRIGMLSLVYFSPREGPFWLISSLILPMSKFWSTFNYLLKIRAASAYIYHVISFRFKRQWLH